MPDEAPPSKVDVVVLALHGAGGSDDAVDTEDVAVVAHTLSPTAFAWQKYPDQINLDSVRVTLYDACKKKYGGLVDGSVGTGWVLTARGVAWVDQRGAAVRVALGYKEPLRRRAARSEGRHLASEVGRLRQSEAFTAWRGGRNPSPRVAAAAFRIDAYTSMLDRHLKVNRLLELVAQANDHEAREFIDTVAGHALDYSPPRLGEVSQGDE